ncbi:pilus assembly protein TadB [Spongiactinospora rosea]|uniref:Pilus assembly protein TadB n=1 Tax=Spongiactinospora rosea TaxID=2248750 RepID=A0A366LXR6_9ACTN|nr:type II secretion system F family protein [Spongiactinospora rosea]RBQ18094.1 pilus assembly protein TadB [Spongiactinospora rosea]
MAAVVISALAMLSALAGAGFGLGTLLMVSGFQGHPIEARPRPTLHPKLLVRLAACAGAGVLVGALTRWPVGAFLGGLGAWFLPQALGPDREHVRRVEKIEAVATWAEMLRDTLAASAGLHQAIMSTAPIVPEAIRREVTEAAARVDRGERLAQALKQLADELADPTADLVCSTLVMASTRQAGHLGELLGRLAEVARAHAVMRLRVAATRARTRSSVRTVIAVTMLMTGGLVLLNRDFLAPYDNATGQAVLLLVGVAFAGSFVLIHRLGRIHEPPRILSRAET